MTNPAETLGAESLPIWMPDEVKGVLAKVLARDPIDLTSPEVLGKHFASRAEIEDVYDVVHQVVHQVESPILIGLNGSRASLNHPPLFETVQAFDLYHHNKARLEGGLQDYLWDHHKVSMKDYKLAREYLQKRGFNEGYRRSQEYPESIVKLLVRDIDLLIIAGGKHIRSRPYVGKRTKVQLDITANSPYHMFEADPEDLESYLQRGLAQTTPLKY